MADNPFEVTKAVDFSDAEIADTWVDLPGGGFSSFADPKSPMPMFLVGGKGGGRTHLLRYSSFALQRLRHQEAVVQGIRSEGYVGIYFRCGGLNSSRFMGKGQGADIWATMFSYYTELWLGRLTLDVIDTIIHSAGDAVTEGGVRAFSRAVAALFDVPLPALEEAERERITNLSRQFERIQRELDIAVNNVALTRRLDVEVGASPGRLVFGIPEAAAKYLPVLRGVVFAYLLDEFENLTEEQQRYVNTLIREKQLPTTFLVGSRLFGLRTHATLSAGEENKLGSEFSQVVLEDAYRARAHQYAKFCEGIVRRRLASSGLDISPRSRLDEFFEIPDRTAPTIEERAQQHASDRRRPQRPWLSRLRRQLSAVGTPDGIAGTIIDNVSVRDSALHEKFAIFLLYRAWAGKDDLERASVRVRADVSALLNESESDSKMRTTYEHYRRDLYAQLLSELHVPQEYYGFGEFVKMSGYLPRNLLVVLKQVTRWSLFLGEQPFRGDRISLQAQREGVREASSWFLSDAKGLGRIGEETQVSIRRLAGLFREMRFSDKPVEVSCAAFATDRHGLSDAARAGLDEAVSHSLLLEIPNGRRDRNSHVLTHKYHLNPMLAPMFDLPTALRGSVQFTADELDAIFDPLSGETFEAVQRRIVGRMRAPFDGGTVPGTLMLGFDD